MPEFPRAFLVLIRNLGLLNEISLTLRKNSIIIEYPCDISKARESMNGKSKSISMIVIGVLLASALIGGVSILQQQGILPGVTSSLSMKSSTSQSSSATRTGILGSGTLVLLLHDPPNAPAGVTHVYVTYSDLGIHIANSHSGSGWLDLSQTGTIDLMSVVNFTQTIAKVVVGEGNFDLLRMNLSSVVITYNTQNYTASVPDNQLTIGIVGGLILGGLSTAGTVIDITPTILMYNSSSSSSSPSFVMVPSAKAYVVPQNHLTQSDQQVGHKEDDSNNSWLTQDISNQYHQSSFKVTSASLSNTSLSVTVQNTGITSVFIQSVYVGPNLTQSGDQSDGGDFGASSVFTVLANGSLIPFGSSNLGYHHEGIGYNLSAKSQVTFQYSGQVSHSFSSTSSASGDNTQHTASDAVQMIQGSSDETSGTTITESTTTLSQTPMTESTSTDSASTGDSYGFNSLQIMSGYSYIIGVTSGDRTVTTVVVAS